jgi:hypothetical protein
MRLAAPKYLKRWQPARGLSSGEGLIVAVADIEEKDKHGNVKTTFTEKRLLVIEPEFSRVLANTRRESNVLSQVMREAYDSGHLFTMTITPREALGAHISIVGHITPTELKKRLTEVEMANGFANRFLWFYVRSDKRMPNAKPIPDEIVADFADQLEHVFEFAHRLSCEGRSVPGKRLVEMDEQTQGVWAAVYDRLCNERPGFVGSITARRPSQVLRLSLLYALLDLSDSIQLPHLQAALAVVAYSAESIELLFGKDTGDTLEDRLYRLLATNETMETKDFYRHIGSKGKDVHEALERMERNGLVKMTKRTHTGPGRPAEVWEAIR